MTDLVEKTENFVSGLLKEKLNENYVFHNLDHTIETVEAAKEIAGHSGISDDELEILLIAAWFHDVGYIDTYEGHEEASCKIAREFLEQESCPEKKIKNIESLIMTTRMDKDPENILQSILRDADIIHIGRKGTFKRGRQLREELMLLLNKSFTDEEWLKEEEEFYSKTRFYSNYAVENFDQQRQKNINKLDKKMNKDNLEDKKSFSEFEKKIKKSIKERVPERGIETVFRLASRNHIRLSGIADNKANTLISINSIIISIVLSVLVDKLEVSGHLVIPTIIILATCVTTIVLSVLSTKPKVTQGHISKEDIENRQGNLLFFGNFFRMSFDEYEWGMNELMHDRDYLYHNLIQDLYYLGLVLEKKYKFLRWAYTIFLYGLIVSVVSFITAAIIV